MSRSRNAHRRLRTIRELNQRCSILRRSYFENQMDELICVITTTGGLTLLERIGGIQRAGIYSIEGRWQHPVVHIAYEDLEAYAQVDRKGRPNQSGMGIPATRGTRRCDLRPGKEFAADETQMTNTWQGEFLGRNLVLEGYEETAPVAHSAERLRIVRHDRQRVDHRLACRTPPGSEGMLRRSSPTWIIATGIGKPRDLRT
jgi:hypothetical protein